MPQYGTIFEGTDVGALPADWEEVIIDAGGVAPGGFKVKNDVAGRRGRSFGMESVEFGSDYMVGVFNAVPPQALVVDGNIEIRTAVYLSMVRESSIHLAVRRAVALGGGTSQYGGTLKFDWNTSTLRFDVSISMRHAGGEITGSMVSPTGMLTTYRYISEPGWYEIVWRIMPENAGADTRFQGKIWPRGEPEPTEPVAGYAMQYVFSGYAMPDNTLVQINNLYPPANNHIEFLGVGTANDPAPTYEELVPPPVLIPRRRHMLTTGEVPGTIPAWGAAPAGAQLTVQADGTLAWQVDAV